MDKEKSLYKYKGYNLNNLLSYLCWAFGLLLHCHSYTIERTEEKHGTKTEAVITSTTIGGHRYTTPNYIYEFYVGDKTYEGNSLVDERDSSKIGTKIQILYLDWLPWFNRPIYYWDD